MNRKKRTEILIRGRKEFLMSITNEIKMKYEYEFLEKPENGLVMIKMRETAKKELFYIGEVLITEAKAIINGKTGLGIVSGDNFETAEALALIDAAYKAEVSETEKWDMMLEEEEKHLQEEEKKKTEKILETKVDFSELAGNRQA